MVVDRTARFGVAVLKSPLGKGEFEWNNDDDDKDDDDDDDGWNGDDFSSESCPQMAKRPNGQHP